MHSGRIGGDIVASFMGAWIEIRMNICGAILVTSHPSWVRGLKFPPPMFSSTSSRVASFMGAWIEILFDLLYLFRILCRILHGCVD